MKRSRAWEEKLAGEEQQFYAASGFTGTRSARALAARAAAESASNTEVASHSLDASHPDPSEPHAATGSSSSSRNGSSGSNRNGSSNGSRNGSSAQSRVYYSAQDSSHYTAESAAQDSTRSSHPGGGSTTQRGDNLWTRCALYLPCKKKAFIVSQAVSCVQCGRRSLYSQGQVSIQVCSQCLML